MTEIKVNELATIFENVSREIDRLVWKVGKDNQNIQVDYENPDEKFLSNEYEEIISTLKSVVNQLNYLEAPIYVEGKLFLQDNGRFTVQDYELTSGNSFEIYDPEYDVWISSRMEHNGKHYYCVALGRDKYIEGYKARIRQSFSPKYY